MTNPPSIGTDPPSIGADPPSIGGDPPSVVVDPPYLALLVIEAGARILPALEVIDPSNNAT